MATRRRRFTAAFKAVDAGVHVLAVHTYTEDAWTRTGTAAPGVLEMPRRQGAGECLNGPAARDDAAFSDGVFFEIPLKFMFFAR